MRVGTHDSRICNPTLRLPPLLEDALIHFTLSDAIGISLSYRLQELRDEVKARVDLADSINIWLRQQRWVDDLRYATSHATAAQQGE